MVHASTRVVRLDALQEFRLELDKTEACSIRLTGGQAEVFGFELAQGADYPFGDEARAAVFTWKGCSISTEYVAVETPLQSYINLHLALERLRILARPPPPANLQTFATDDEEQPGPRIMVVGERNSGKTTLVKTLINWALRSGRARSEGSVADDRSRSMLLVNLDPDEGAVTAPATFSAAVINAPLPSTTPVHVLGSTFATGVPIPYSAPTNTGEKYLPTPNSDAFPPTLDSLVYFYGHTEWAKNEALAELLVSRLASYVVRKLDEGSDEGLWRGGMIIDTPGEWTEKGKSQVIAKRVREYGVDILLVVGGEKLQVEMSRLMATNQTVTVVRVPQSPGVSDAEVAYRQRMRDRQIHAYFYGGPLLSHGALSPHSISVPFEHMTIFRVGEEYVAPSSALPIGASRQTNDTALVEVEAGKSELLNAVLALKQAADDEDDEDIVASSVLGLVHIAHIDTAKKRYKILSPQAGRLPRKKAIFAGLDWQDT